MLDISKAYWAIPVILLDISNAYWAFPVDSQTHKEFFEKW